MAAPAVTREIEFDYGSVAVESVAAGTGVYTLSATAPLWMKVGVPVRITKATNGANNGLFTITGVAGTLITTDNSASVVEAASPAEMAFPVGSTTPYQVDASEGKWKLRLAYENGTLGFDVVIQETDEDTFNTLALALTEAFSIPHERLRIMQNGKEQFDFDPADSTGFNHQPTADKRSSPHDSGRSRAYSVTVDFMLPAKKVGKAGRQDSTVEVRFDESKIRTLIIQGRYTTLAGVDARTQFQTAFDTYANAVKNAVDAAAIWEEVRRAPVRTDDENAIADFQVEFRELILDQEIGVRDSLKLQNTQINIAKEDPAPGDSTDRASKRLARIRATMETAVDHTESTALEDLFDNTIQPYIISLVKARFSPGALSLLDKQYTPDLVNNRIIAAFVFEASINGDELIEYQLQAEIFDDRTRSLIGVWDEKDYSKEVHRGKGSRRRMITETLKFLDGRRIASVPGSAEINIFEEIAPDVPPDGEVEGWVTLNRRVVELPLEQGQDGETFETVTQVITTEQEWVVVPATTGGGGREIRSE